MMTEAPAEMDDDEIFHFRSLTALRHYLEEQATARGLCIQGCPCFHVTAEGVRFDGHCWRTCLACEHCGVHVTSDAPLSPEAWAVAQLLKQKLDAMDWYGEWALSWEPMS